MQKGDLCLVTGVSGYLGSWLAKQLTDQGYRVRGTIRSLGDTARVDALHRILPGVELTAADLRKPDGWGEAVAGVRWVFHVASPQAVPSEKDRTGGAVQGTEYLMRAALGESSVEKIVLTSSEAAIAYGHPRTKRHFTEDDWTALDGAAGKIDYFRSKTLAERLAWDLVADPKANPRKVPLTAINPSFIAGPSLVPWGRFSLDSLSSMATGKIPALPDMQSRVVDVRDVAAMHIALMDNPETNGHRHFCFAATGKMTDMTDAVRENYASVGFAPKSRTIPTWLLRIIGLFSAQVGGMMSMVGVTSDYDTKYPGVYRYRFTDLGEIVRASMDSMIEHGWIKPKRKA